MARYEAPTIIEDGMILGRANLGVYRANRNYFYGLADRWRTIPRGALNVQFHGTNPTEYVWDGYHLLWGDATLFHHSMSLEGDKQVRLTLTYNGTIIKEIRGGQAIAETYDLSTLGLDTPGLYRVQFTMTRPDAGVGVNTKATVPAPFTTYTGSQRFRAPPAIKNGDTSNTTLFDVWRSNDLRFHAITPPQPPFYSESTSWGSSGSKNHTFWRGWIRHSGATRLYYWISCVPKNDRNRADNKIQLYYGDEKVTEVYPITSGGGGAESLSATYAESYADLTGNYTPGTWYPVEVRMVRGVSSSKFTSSMLMTLTLHLPSTTSLPPLRPIENGLEHCHP